MAEPPEKHRHHFTPVHYLKNFTDPDPYTLLALAADCGACEHLVPLRLTPRR